MTTTTMGSQKLSLVVKLSSLEYLYCDDHLMSADNRGGQITASKSWPDTLVMRCWSSVPGGNSTIFWLPISICGGGGSGESLGIHDEDRRSRSVGRVYEKLAVWHGLCCAGTISLPYKKIHCPARKVYWKSKDIHIRVRVGRQSSGISHT